MEKDEQAVEQAQDIDATEEVEPIEQAQEDKPVEQSQFNKYRAAYLREQLAALNIKQGVETDAAIAFIEEKADETDSNLSEVLHELKLRMRVEERKSYVDPSMGNSIRSKPAAVDRSQIGRDMFARLQQRGLIR